ncbi:DUF1990 family protein [Tautonia plasticadhaerens]|uniref:DUF1990 domain-containing protein n=1 Tax=Tautonia plasticadhaerens TaxID=2527974 RepID=A0A518GXZ8_9BACT|nr:DUF1990 family protein [Tautonia plasticadhaerens]QDV33471.1 hypothetical protein ElP_13430 [Tautonia plasticadhaerens]
MELARTHAPWPWRFGRGWSEGELQAMLAALSDRPVNFDEPADRMTVAHGWTVDGSHDSLGVEAEGPPEPDGIYQRARQGVINYDFSDPSIVVGHFDPDAPALDRDMLLELKVLGFRFLGGCRVTEVREQTQQGFTVFGFRYDTLAGHIERGFEWFLLTKDHLSGEVHFQIEAHWLLGDFPNWWSRVGFLLIGERYRHRWRVRAPERLRRLARDPAPHRISEPGKLAHRGDPEPHRTEPSSGR